ncbi:MAG: glycoside hydrolase N-terminal domain-containing protein [Firmicutes bacterium]|nr:glycoside hydrolase N-terminal domain-containing protein [Bacillota bacterium]
MRIDKDTLFMKYPSTWHHDIWREALVSGNGAIGASVHGGCKYETTILTHHDLWHCGRNQEVPDVHEAFPRMRKMMDEENFREASWEMVNELRKHDYKTELGSPLPLADLLLEIQPHGGFSDYIRGLHMDTGEIGAEWKDSGVQRTSYSFVSRSKDIIVKKITSSQADLELKFNLVIHENDGSEYKVEKYAKHALDSKQCDIGDTFIDYTALNDDGTLYGAVARVCPIDGWSESTLAGLKVHESSEVIVMISLFIKQDPAKRKQVLAKAHKKLAAIPVNYDALLAEHARKHRKLYRSAELSLGYRGKYHFNEDLMDEAFTDVQSVELVEKLWKFGRYLFISGTSDHTNPFPLYGLWPGDYQLIWTLNLSNENTQIIYWHSYVGNLLSTQKGLYEYHNRKIPDYKKLAQNIWGLKGLYMNPGTSPIVSNPGTVVPVILNWQGASGWMAQHYCNYYFYTRDEEFLHKTLLPYLIEVADFYEDFIQFYPDGTIHFYPSVSPENSPQNFMPPEHIVIPHAMPTAVNATMDLAIVKEFFTNLITIAKEHGLYEDRLAGWEKILASIPEYKSNDQGAIREWQDERFDDRYDHRHLSHIYPVFPGTEVNDLHGAELLPAFDKAVRLRKIDAQTGWSMAHMSAIYARLEDGAAAMQCLNYMAKICLIRNFFTLHNDWRGMNLTMNHKFAPVQLDAIMGYVNAIQEMVFYASNDLLKFLPAIPSHLEKGRVKSFRYPNGSLNMNWDVAKGHFSATLTACREHEVWLKMPPQMSQFEFVCDNCTISEEKGLYKLTMQENGKLKILAV